MTRGEELLIRNRDNGKILYAVAYENPFPRIRYILAKNRGDALRQVIKSRRSMGKIVGVAPAVGYYGKHEERKRVYCFGR